MSIYIFIKNTLRITNAIRKKGGLEVNLAAIDPELQEDFIENFHAVVSQKKTINKTLLGRIAKGYADIDEAMRIYTWNCTYIAVKEAANDYLSGKINSKKFFAITKIDTMMNAETSNAICLLEAGKSRELAGYVAYNNTLDMHTAYKITAVSAIEREPGHRFLKFYARAIIRPELIYRRGIRPFVEGIEDFDFSRAKRGLINIPKYLAISIITGSLKLILITLGWLIIPIVHWTVRCFHKKPHLLCIILGSLIVFVIGIAFRYYPLKKIVNNPTEKSSEIQTEATETETIQAEDAEISKSTQLISKTKKNKATIAEKFNMFGDTDEQQFGLYTVRTERALNGDGTLEILKSGQTIYTQHGGKFQIGDRGVMCNDSEFELISGDLTGNGKANLVIYEWSGGAHCCYTMFLFEFDEDVKKIAEIDGEDSVPEFTDIDGDFVPELSFHDMTYAYWPESFAYSPTPLVILRWLNDSYVIAPDLMSSPAPSMQELEKKAAKIRTSELWTSGPEYNRAIILKELFGNALDLIYAGHEDLGWKFIEMAWTDKFPIDNELLEELRGKMASSPYWMELKEKYSNLEN